MPLRAHRLVTVLLLAPTVGQGAEFSILPDGTGDFPTVQAAVDAAAAGDTIVLEDGLFSGPGNRDITFGGKDVIVRSGNGPAFTTIDCEGTQTHPHRAFRLDQGETPAARIEGLTIKGGFVDGPFPESGGGGILVAYDTAPTITNCVFDGNRTGFQGFGAGLLAWENCDITLTDCVFIHGESGWYGGGFVLRKGCDAVVERCLVDQNYALHAGGGISITNSHPQVTDCLFTNNWVTEAGGGGVLVKAEAEPVFTRCIFAGNTSWSGSGMGLGNWPKVTLVDCLFDGNVAVVGGGGGLGLDEHGCEVIATNCTFVNNRAPGSGQHLFVNQTSIVTLRNSIFWGGCAAVNPAYVALNGTIDVDCSIVEGGESAITGVGNVVYGPSNQDVDPEFCAPGNCETQAGDYTIAGASPAAPWQSPCGLVGAYPVACGVTSAGFSLEPESWSAVKARYRRTP
ncbi:MAG: right-handed parallel beta-helix repeat-containing protein [bacterium]